ncbi:MAG: 1-acyl-sn-glycerol-3-phosphate acyltransferase [Acidimicrobiia bacterium]|nr:1-acyl-sn-glycerol-3-phosphate acyltransferase [Acidimicrobiia bacterium]
MKNKKSIMYSICSYLILPIYKVLVKEIIEGEHFIPTQEPVIIISNHISFIDPLNMAYLLKRRKRQVSFLAKDSLFENLILRWFLNHCQQIPVSRDSDRSKDSLLLAEEALAKGKCVGIYPEATISDLTKLLPLKSGALRLAQKSGVEIIVIGTYGAHKIWTKGSRVKFRFRTKNSIVVSKGFKVSKDQDIEQARKDLYIKMTDLVLKAKQKLGD